MCNKYGYVRPNNQTLFDRESHISAHRSVARQSMTIQHRVIERVFNKQCNCILIFSENQTNQLSLYVRVVVLFEMFKCIPQEKQKFEICSRRMSIKIKPSTCLTEDILCFAFVFLFLLLSVS